MKKIKQNRLSKVDLPLVTIVTPSFNHGRFIEKTIRSVVEQDYPNIEYWIIDGGSEDSSIEIIRRYADRYKFIHWISEPDDGQTQAINKGFKKAKGEIVAWMNSDDTYRKGAIRKAVDVFTLHPGYKMIYGDAFIIDEFDRRTGIFPYTEKVFNYKRLVSVSDYISQPTVFMKREIFLEIGYLDESLNWCMDWDLWIRIANKYPVGYISFFMANHRDYPLTKTRIGGRDRFNEISRVVRKYSEKKYPPAFIIYGLGTLMMHSDILGWMRNLENISLFRWVINYFTNKFKYLYSDNWVSREIEFIFFGHKSHFSITGFLLGKSVPYRFEIRVNGKKIHSGAIKKSGKFNFKLRIPENMLCEGRNFISIKSLKTFVLTRKDRRRVSFRLVNYSFKKQKEKKIKWPKVSVITLFSDRSKFIVEAIRSVAQQDYPNKEHLIVFEPGENDSNDIVKKYSRRYPFVKCILSKNQGKSQALNWGIKMASGDIISWLNANDQYESGGLKTAAEFFLNHAGEYFVLSNGTFVDESGNRIEGVPIRHVDKKYFFRKNEICRSSVFWRKEIHKYIGYFSEYLNYSADLDFWIRAADAFKVNTIGGHLITIRLQKATEADHYLKVNREILNIINNNYGTISWNWAFRFGSAYAKQKLKLSKNSLFRRLLFNCLVFCAAVYKIIFFSPVFIRKQKRTIL